MLRFGLVACMLAACGGGPGGDETNVAKDADDPATRIACGVFEPSYPR